MSLFIPKDRRSLFRQFLGGMYDAVVITDPNGHILDVNARATEHFGYELEEILDREVSRLVPGLKSAVVQRIRKELEGNRHVMINANGVSRAGVKFACEIAVSVIDLMNPGDLVFTIRNIEKRRAMMNTFLSLENAFKLSPTALFVADASGRLVETNDAFRAMFDPQQDFFTTSALKAALTKALAGKSVRVKASFGEVVLAPNEIGRRIEGVVGSVSRS